MRPVTQTITVGDGSGRIGNYLQAAVASLLELDLDEVPHFAEHDDWLERMVADHGYQVVYRPHPVAFGLAFGRSPRGVAHAVVCIDGVLVWDPAPVRGWAGVGVELRRVGADVRLFRRLLRRRREPATPPARELCERCRRYYALPGQATCRAHTPPGGAR